MSRVTPVLHPLLRVLLVPFLAVLATEPAGSQVIRSYESLDRTAGEEHYATLGVTLQAKSGNTELVEADLAGAVGYKGSRHWIRLYPSYSVRRSEGKTVEDARAAHLRHSYFLSERTRSFAFVQIQADQSLEVQHRFLVGGGLRRTLLSSVGGGGIDLGVGAMHESERIESGAESSVIRGTNVLVVNGGTGPVALTFTGYFQPLLADWRDHRISVAGSAAVPLGNQWNLDVSFVWRRDSRPPTEVKPNDAALKVGIRFSVD